MVIIFDSLFRGSLNLVYRRCLRLQLLYMWWMVNGARVLTIDMFQNIMYVRASAMVSWRHQGHYILHWKYVQPTIMGTILQWYSDKIKYFAFRIFSALF